MSEDLTRKLSDNDKDAILTAIRNLESVVRNSFDNLVTWVSSVDSRLKRLDQKVDERIHDTRPIWQKVLDDIAHLQAGQDGMRSEVRQLSNKVDDVYHEQAVFSDAIRKMNLEFHAVDERLHRIEVNQKPLNSST